MVDFFSGIWDAFYFSFIEAERWRFYLEGLGNTLAMAGIACLIGVFIGLVLAIFKVASSSLSPVKPKSRSARLGRIGVQFLGKFAGFYTTVIRGTPVVLQLLIVYYGVFRLAPKEYKLLIAGLSFGINSGAYVCEIIRAGIQSVDRGQMEAGRCLGLGQGQTMRLIILPQATRNILPTLFNELIALLKETSIAGYIAITDLTRAGDLIRFRVLTITPLVISGLIYLVLVILLTKLQGVLERRLGAGDRRL